ncbi:unnamed protein product, partial [Rotaria socialis]
MHIENLRTWTNDFMQEYSKSLRNYCSELNIFLLVSRTKTYDNIQATTRRLGPIKRCLFNMALSAKARDVEEHRV